MAFAAVFRPFSVVYTEEHPVTYDPDAEIIFAAMPTELTGIQKRKISDFMVTIKNAGIWELLDTFYMPSAAASEANCLVDWKRPAKVAAFSGVTADFDTGFGFTNHTGGYIDTDYNPAADAVNVAQNDWTAFCWVTSLPDLSTGFAWHPLFQRQGSTLQLRAYDFDYRLEARANNANPTTTAAEAFLEADELFAVGRSASNLCAIYKGSASVKTSATASSAWATTTEAYNVRLLEFGDSTDIVGGVGVFGMGAFLDTTKLATLKSAIQAYLS